MNDNAKIVVSTTTCPADEQQEVVSAALVFKEPHDFHVMEICGASEQGYRTLDDYEDEEIVEFVERWRKKAATLDVPFEVEEDVKDLVVVEGTFTECPDCGRKYDEPVSSCPSDDCPSHEDEKGGAA
ncbi:MAG: hypothetical protein Q8K86_11635 [Candidatus Nanopelagicaceae bacterium]|nr:hypothetical protein [Candidatus Nanopelagicaceae bacterium]